MHFVSIIITAFREPRTVHKAIWALADSSYSGYEGDFECILVCPDDETAQAGRKIAKKLKLGKRFRIIKDPQTGKPTALNLAFKEAQGDVLVLSDGDVYADKGALRELVKPFIDESVGGVTGRPVADHDKSTIWNYWGHILSEAAHLTRDELPGTKAHFFPLSGYLMAIRNLKWHIPENVLADDAYISYMLIKKGLLLDYAPEARVMVKYPQSLGDYLKQKKRSVGGYLQLKQYPEIEHLPQTRSFIQEVINYTLFVINYPQSIKQFWWSVLLFPFRIWLWIMIWWERVILKKDFASTWTRIESTK